MRMSLKRTKKKLKKKYSRMDLFKPASSSTTTLVYTQVESTNIRQVKTEVVTLSSF
ncbi:unnamed protein product [Strongylus vulgaris]|uniref:Uncharacterized protein n=1 Tax=Strongylus vulgaris TaxID=40348 RepID=A0A3P7KXQ0_STRVU|nr:unnamed protein product [Strongylus vulgaris]